MQQQQQQQQQQHQQQQQKSTTTTKTTTTTTTRAAKKQQQQDKKEMQSLILNESTGDWRDFDAQPVFSSRPIRTQERHKASHSMDGRKG